MAYNPNIPQPTDIPRNSPADFLANFQAINDFVNVDHVGFNDTQAGKHEKVHLRKQGTDPTTDANEGALYSKTVGTRIEPFYRYASSGVIADLLPIKAWCCFKGDGALGVNCTIYSSLNITSVYKDSASEFIVTMTNALADNKYAVIGSGSKIGAVTIDTDYAPTTSVFYLRTTANVIRANFLVLGS
jgi:hypothetical protein